MEFKKVSKNALIQWLLYRSILFLLAVGGLISVILFVPFDRLDPIINAVIIVVSILILLTAFIYAYIISFIQYKNLRYKICEDRIERLSGAIFLKHQVVPFVRMQHVDIFRGLTHRILGMSNITIFTAGSSIVIPNLNVKVAEELLIEINQLLEKLKEGEDNE